MGLRVPLGQPAQPALEVKLDSKVLLALRVRLALLALQARLALLALKVRLVPLALLVLRVK